jgi:SagB-type dehydrogenase family enzyme
MKDVHKLLRADGWSDWDSLKTDQRTGVPSPPIQSELPESTQTITLIPPEKITLGRMPLFSAIEQRRSHRKFTGEPLTIEELSFLMWATQGLTRTVGKQGANLRTVPSGGGRHPFETYLAVLRVEELPRGIYRYDALDHRLLRLESAPIPTPEMLRDGCRHQNYFTDAAVAFIWTAVPYRTYWRYEKLSAKIIAQDSGHMCQNLYLAATSIGAGTCALDGYFQDEMDRLVGVDGQKEFVVYVAPVGKIAPREKIDHDTHFKAKYGHRNRN